MIFWLSESKTLSTGLASVPRTPNALRVGPMARMSRVLGLSPRTVMPGMTTLAPVPTLARAERLTRPLKSSDTDAGALLALPDALVAMHVKSPTYAAVTAVRSRTGSVVLQNSLPLKYHVKVGLGEPVAAAVSVMLAPI